MSDIRRAWDGQWYTADEFITWYGKEAAQALLAEAEERSATEHSVERRICFDGVAYTKQEMRAWYGEAADKIWNEAQAPKASAAEHGDSSSAVLNEASTESGAAAHNETSTESGAAIHASAGAREDRDADGGDSDDLGVLQSTVLLRVEELPGLRTSRKLSQGLHKPARELLQQWTRAPEQEPIDLTLSWPDWRVYIAKHKRSEDIVGPGVVSVKAQRVPDTPDPNRGGQNRLDFFVHRLDGTAVRLHPGTTRASDAAIAVVPAKVLQTTLDDLALIPQIDRVSCHDAFNRLVKDPLDDTDLTDGSRFPWPRFVANLGRLTPAIMGEGSVSNVRLADVQTDKVVLEFTRSNETMVRLCLVKYEGKSTP